MRKLYRKFQVLLALSLLAVGTVSAQQFSLNGKVTDSGTGEPLAGVNVIVKGTTIGVITDIDGNYNLTIPGTEGVIVASFIGYLTKELPVNSTTGTLNIDMVEDVTNLEEVVVTGLASSVKRSNLANAVSTVSADELLGTTDPQTLDNALYGKLNGVNINANGGAPGGGISVQLRGISTLGAGSSQPLYIVDGVYVDNSTIRTGRTQVSGASSGQNATTQDNAANRIADLNPEDIESIEVLKGSSAAAIYGTRANAGVIIITTKKGKAGKTKVSLRQDLGIARALNLQDFDDWNPDKITAFFGTGERAEAELQAYLQAVAEGRITNWEEEFYGETPLLSNTQVSVSGGNEKTTFYVSGGLRTEDGILKNTGFDRYSIRANIDHKFSKKLDMSLNSNYIRSSTQRGFTGNQNNTGGSIGYNIAYLPSYADIFPDAQGNYPNNPYFNDNPLAIRDLGVNDSDVDRFIVSSAINLNLLQTDNSLLKFTAQGGIDYISANSLVYFPEILQHQQALANPGDVMWGRNDNLNTNWQAFLIFNTNVGKTNFNTQVGTVRLHQSVENLLTRGRGLSGGQTNLRWATVQSIQGQFDQTVTDVGIVAQEEINWDDKIIGTVGVRFDRSTLNRDQDKFYAFPKASVAANIANFDFWTVNNVNQLKLRAAYGETGGLPNFGNTFESLTPQLIGGSLGGQVSVRGVDPNLEPETASELEFGLDASFFGNLISLEATYYIKEVNDLILDQVPAESTGIQAIATNAADLENKGIELALSGSPVRTNNVNWFSKVLYWKNRAEITRLNIPPFTTGGFGPTLGTYLIAEGLPPTTIVGTPGDADTPGGFTMHGDRLADFQMTFLNQITLYKNWELSFLFHWKQGGDNINLSAFLWDDGGTTPNWNGDDDGDGIPNGEDRQREWISDNNAGVYIQDASYVKLREIGLYYTLPQNLTTRLFNGLVERVKLGFSGNNLFLWTDYESYDPEVSNFGSQPIASNIEVTPYPTSRRMFFHLNIDF
ncbi:MAG: SusC/RagA family TonB-linked outer membrane protein [Cytophagales bacterium]|nr:SusC/RagA family TonB-linked outer membrane protein [Cytophagales bacterium]